MMEYYACSREYGNKCFRSDGSKPNVVVGRDGEGRKRGTCNEKDNNERYDDKTGVLQCDGAGDGIFFAGASAGRDHCVCG